jgi:M6 family metalloprotease-like protein
VFQILIGSLRALRYLSENSGRKYEIQDAGIIGWLEADYEWDFYWRKLPESRFYAEKWEGTSHYWVDEEGRYEEEGQAWYLDNEGFVGGQMHSWWEAVTRANTEYGFKYHEFDEDRDGVLNPDEFLILIIKPQAESLGHVRYDLHSLQVNNEFKVVNEKLKVDGMVIPRIAEVYTQSGANIGLYAHELAHALLDATDLYFKSPHPINYPWRAGSYSLMDNSSKNPHLDPVHKLCLGWLNPRFVSKSGIYQLSDVETQHEVIILYNPSVRIDEYFFIENRWPGETYDKNLPDSGLAIWHVIQNPKIYGVLPAPEGVDSAAWNIIKPGDWGRRAIRMIRPIKKMPIDDTVALWDGSDPSTGYDLLSVDTVPTHVTLRWSNGDPSGFSIKDIPTPNSIIEIKIEVKQPDT